MAGVATVALTSRPRELRLRGWALLDGGMPCLDVYAYKPPMNVLLNALVMGLFGAKTQAIRAMDIAWTAVTRLVIRPGGLFVAMQSDIRYAAGAYWDYYDHVLPLSDRSAREGFDKSGFVVEDLVPRVWPLLGKQFVTIVGNWFRSLRVREA